MLGLISTIRFGFAPLGIPNTGTTTSENKTQAGLPPGAIRFGFRPRGSPTVATGSGAALFQSGLPPNALRFGFMPRGSSGVTPTTQQGNWDTSDPVFYDWWRKRAKEERAKLEEVVEEITEAAPALRQETIEAVESAASIDQLQFQAQSLDLLKYERDIIKAAIADYKQWLDADEEDAEFLLLN